MVVSRAAKQSRTSDTTLCHERSILIERSLKRYHTELPNEKTLLKQLRITSYIRLMLNKYSLFFFSNAPRNIGQSVIFFFFSTSSSSFAGVGLALKNFEPYISTFILAGDMKLLIQALQ